MKFFWDDRRIGPPLLPNNPGTACSLVVNVYLTRGPVSLFLHVWAYATHPGRSTLLPTLLPSNHFLDRVLIFQKYQPSSLLLVGLTACTYELAPSFHSILQLTGTQLVHQTY